jgi:hypothetical protein
MVQDKAPEVETAIAKPNAVFYFVPSYKKNL